jgi:hypothetical protein
MGRQMLNGRNRSRATARVAPTFHGKANVEWESARCPAAFVKGVASLLHFALGFFSFSFSSLAHCYYTW